VVELDLQGSDAPTKEELQQQVVERMFSLMKQIHHDLTPVGPLLSPPQARLVFIIARRGSDGISVKELAREANITPGAITQFTDVLIAKSLVRREADPVDRRIIRLKITPSAHSQMELFRREFLGSAARKLDALSVAELQGLVGLLTKVCPEPYTTFALPITGQK
jgi:DNA-binding MarR family transcriptional regulator